MKVRSVYDTPTFDTTNAQQEFLRKIFNVTLINKIFCDYFFCIKYFKQVKNLFGGHLKSFRLTISKKIFSLMIHIPKVLEAMSKKSSSRFVIQIIYVLKILQIAC